MRRPAVVSIVLALAALVLSASWPEAHAAQIRNPVPYGWPKFVVIPRINVKAPVEALAMTSAADAHAPYKWGDVAWYDRSPRPGDVGRSMVFGHLDSYCCPAVFYGLRYLKRGDVVQVQYKQGRPLTFKVMWSDSYWANKLPNQFLFGRSNQRDLILMTCTGIFHPGAGGGYDHKLVVYARFVG
jgi:sortase (surface protein transpeptidase)